MTTTNASVRNLTGGVAPAKSSEMGRVFHGPVYGSGDDIRALIPAQKWPGEPTAGACIGDVVVDAQATGMSGEPARLYRIAEIGEAYQAQVVGDSEPKWYRTARLVWLYSTLDHPSL